MKKDRRKDRKIEKITDKIIKLDNIVTDDIVALSEKGLLSDLLDVTKYINNVKEMMNDIKEVRKTKYEILNDYHAELPSGHNLHVLCITFVVLAVMRNINLPVNVISFLVILVLTKLLYVILYRSVIKRNILTSADNICFESLEEKTKFTNKDGEEVTISDNVIDVMDILTDNVYLVEYNKDIVKAVDNEIDCYIDHLNVMIDEVNRIDKIDDKVIKEYVDDILKERNNKGNDYNEER